MGAPVNKAILGLLLLSSAALVSCSNGGGGGEDYTTELQMNPYDVPANAASDESVKKLFQEIKASGKYMPSDKVMFTRLIENGGVATVARDSNEYQTELNKLNTEGRQFLNEIKSNCQIQDARVTNEKKAEPKSGSVNLVEAVASIGGKNCLVNIHQNGSKKTTYSHVDYSDAKNGNYTASGNFHQIQMNSSTVKGLLQAKSGVKGEQSTNTVNGKFDIVYKKFEQTMRARYQFNSEISVEFTNGRSFKSLIEGEVLNKGLETVKKVRFKGTFAAKNFYYTQIERGSQKSYYFNGREISKAERNELMPSFQD